MPYKIYRSKNCFKVKNTDTGKIFSKCTSKKKASAQLRLLRLIEYKMKGGGESEFQDLFDQFIIYENETDKEREERLRKNAYQKRRRENETDKEREERLRKIAYQKRRRENETYKEREERLRKKAEYRKRKFDNETEEEREERLRKQREYDRNRNKKLKQKK